VPLPDRPLILVVDDALPVRVVMSRALTTAGYDVLTAPDGQAAIIVLQGLHSPPDLVITDLRMPLMDGEALAGWLRRARPQLPIIFVSGFPTQLQDLPGPFLAKPFTPDDLLQAVQRLLPQRAWSAN
jgi:CheY-like chemotaxis protein